MSTAPKALRLTDEEAMALQHLLRRDIEVLEPLAAQDNYFDKTLASERALYAKLDRFTNLDHYSMRPLLEARKS